MERVWRAEIGGELKLAAARITLAFYDLIEAERGRFALWLPVFLGAGDIAYFARNSEPPLWLGAAGMALGAVGFGALHRHPLARLVPGLAFVVALGFAAAQCATWRAPPLLALPRHAVSVSGRVDAIEGLPEGSRLLLTEARIDDGAVLPRRLRLRLRHDDAALFTIGETVSLRALLMPPPEPAYPGAWDLQRDDFFHGLGGYGTALGPIRRLAPAPAPKFEAAIEAIRAAIAARVMAVLPDSRGAIAATLLSGFSAAIPETDRAAFRDAGLAHLLAIAGLHIGIVMGLVLGFARLLLAALEWPALYWPARQIAALAALAAGGAYLLLTGAHVPIRRSFAMACLVTLGLLVGRRALSLRGLALAAGAVLLGAPEEIVGVSFQMSFSAVLALISGYEALWPALFRITARWRRHLVMLALTSLLAGTASAPFGAAHFGRVQLYFVLANLIAVPITAFWVMPCGLVALALMPLGLAALALVPMGWGISLILAIARTIAALPAATIPVAHIPGFGLLLIALGMAWLGLWRSRLRLWGAPILLLGLLSPLAAPPPDLLVSPDAKLIGLRTEAGVFVLAQPGASRFTRDAWAEYWARGPLLPASAAPPGAVACDDAGACRLRPAPGRAAALWLSADKAAPAACEGVALVVSPVPLRDACRGVLHIDRFTVWREGAVAVWLEASGARVLSERAWRGIRPWVPPAPAPQHVADRPQRSALPLAAEDAGSER
ncbi:MAG: ComEC/Rec2 family competence protein [Acidibrevibacterium sp.]|uniref:ComEC/Rec2 family competence protein n=1 Tax=Acidibrevibacterium sp. TaxID=2606776 RepID=UPI003CFE4E20